MSKTQSPYISNPFKLAHQAAKRLYNTNRVWAIVFIILGVLNTFSSANSTQPAPAADPATSSNPEISVAFIVFIVSMVALFLLVAAVISTYITGIVSYVTLQSEKGKHASLGEAFRATKDRFWRLFGALLLAGVKILGWTLLLIVPGIIAALRYTLLGYVIMDEPAKNTSVKASHDRVKQVVNGRLYEVLGISFISILPFIGTLYSTAGNAGLYMQLKTYTDKKLEKPAIHWFNAFLPFLIVIFFVVSFAVIGYISYTR